jgi:two-component system phosphate regulon sensor histidine kinase PhoR
MIPSGQGAIAILHDTTDLERLEQIRKDFVANVSHELRTPLAGIIGYADTLLDGALEDAQNNRRFLEIIRGNAIQLSSIASDLLVLSELESGFDPPEPEPIPVREVLEAVLLTVQAEASSRGVTLIPVDIEDVEVLGFRLRLEQAVLNLVANAIKFNRPGGEVRVGACRIADGRVMIQVSDTGTGIPSQDLPRIFERFYRVDKGRSRQVGGTGLGLSIVKHVVERMNGSVSVESQLGKGTSFTVTLPAAASPAQL